MYAVYIHGHAHDWHMCYKQARTTGTVQVQCTMSCTCMGMTYSDKVIAIRCKRSQYKLWTIEITTNAEAVWRSEGTYDV